MPTDLDLPTLDLIPVALMVISMTGLVLWMNSIAELLHGLDPGEWYGKTVFDLLSPDEHELAFQRLTEMRSHGIDVNPRAWTFTPRNGEPVTVVTTRRPCRYDGEEAMLVTTSVPTTEAVAMNSRRLDLVERRFAAILDVFMDHTRDIEILKEDDQTLRERVHSIGTLLEGLAGAITGALRPDCS